MAGGVGLKILQAIVERNGLPLSIGEVDMDSLTPDVMQIEDGPQPREVAARIAAHLGHRIPGVRKLEKRLEGQDKTSGILSDIGALIGQLYYRNQDEINGIIAHVLSDKLTPRKRTSSNGTPPPGTRVDFGKVGDPPAPSTNGGSSDA